jgi:PAS domain S-box-containing protein
VNERKGSSEVEEALMSTTGASYSTPIALDRDVFMRRLIASLGHLNEGILGSDVAGAYVMNVGLSMGAAIEAEYKRFWGIDRLFTVDEYAHVIVDLKQKIQGNFSLVSKNEEKVVVRTTSCPFDEFVRQSPSLCFMTSSVFGGIAARNFGYAKSVLHKRIALGDPGCYVSVYLQRTPEAEAAVGREYYPDVDLADPNIAEQLRLMDSVRHLRRQLVETASRWDEVVNGAVLPICVVQAQGSIAFANARWRELLGREGGELVGADFGQLVHPEERDACRAALERVQAGERFLGLVWRFLHRDGTWRHVVVSGGPVRDDQGAVRGALLLFRDVTDEQEAQRLKDTLLSTASHELRTPVTTIKGMTQLLLRMLERGETLPAEQLARRLRTIQREADRLALLGTDLADVARMKIGRLASNPEVQDLRPIVSACVTRQRERLGDRPRHRLELRQPSVPVLTRADATRLAQVLDNLIENAIKYSPEGGDVTVTTEVADSTASVSVADQGIGIPEADLPKLGSPFFRASNASARNFIGMGLGLHLSRAILEAHGGALTIASREAKGTTVSLSLPLAEAESA